MSGGPGRLVLVGVGHAHLEVLRRLIRDAHPPVELTVVSPGDRHVYSGMVPGYLRGFYSEGEIAFHLPPLVAAAGGELIRSRARGIDADRRIVRLDDGSEVKYELASFNVGSRAAGAHDPAIGRHAVPVKPLEKALDLRRRLQRLAARPGSGPRRVAVVGAGAAGVEVACCVAGALDEAGTRRELAILEAASRILDGYPDRFRRLAAGVLEEKGIRVRTGSEVVRVGSDSVALEDGSTVGAELTVWLAGAAAPPLFSESGLHLDGEGFLLVDESLRSVSHPRVFGAGDCVALEAHPETPKAGVYAVRQGPVLWRSMLAALDGSGREAPAYEPQASFLSILNTGDGRALLRYRRLVSHSRWAWWLKDWVDRRFMRRYRRLEA